MADLDINNSEELSNTLEKAYQHVSPSSEYRANLLQSLLQADTQVVAKPLWRLNDWAIIVAVIIIAIIIYGLWLPGHVITELFP